MEMHIDANFTLSIELLKLAAKFQQKHVSLFKISVRKNWHSEKATRHNKGMPTV